MTLEALRPEPCWELPHHAEEERELLPHYLTRDDAMAARVAEMRALKDDYDDPDDLKDARKRLMKSQPVQRARVCVRLVCDGCEMALDHEDELVDPATTGLHLDSEDVDASYLRDRNWHGPPDGRTHRCPDCPPTAEDLEHEARLPGPDDVPLFPLAGEDPLDA